MKKILFLILIFNSFFSFSQGEKKVAIDWIPLDKAEKFAEKYDKNIFILFYRPGCEYCEKMKKTTLIDPVVVKLINENFLPVMINGKDKNPITYNGTVYINEHPAAEDAPWRHDLYVKLVDPVKGNYYWPDVVIINGQQEKLAQFPGFQPKAQLLRGLKPYTKN
ncbi:MAG: thioredoxin fold domain-containing protein [Flavobacteriales bacterium]|jgi:thioredoxin-related protein|nr:thioredoxin fold domain-containing protein [Flavobacteriales bacterium]